VEIDGLNIERFSIENPSVVQVKTIGNKLKLTGLRQGETNLLLWRPSGLQIKRIVVGAPPQEFFDASFGTLQIANEVNSGITESWDLDPITVNNYVSSFLKLSRNTFASFGFFATKTTGSKYELDIRSVSLRFNNSGLSIHGGDVSLLGVKNAMLHGASLQYTTTPQNSDTKYTFGISGGSVSEAYDYFNIKDYWGNQKAIGGDLIITRRNFKFSSGMNAWKTNEGNWTWLGSLSFALQLSEHLTVSSSGTSFRGKNTADAQLFLTFKHFSFSSIYSYTEADYSTFVSDYLYPRTHEYSINLSEQITPSLSLFQFFSHSLTYLSTNESLQDGASISTGLAIQKTFSKNLQTSFSFSHIQTNSRYSDNNQINSDTTFNEKASIDVSWRPHIKHLLKFRCSELFRKAVQQYNNAWTIESGLNIGHNWIISDRKKYTSTLNSNFGTDIYYKEQNNNSFNLGTSFSQKINRLSLSTGFSMLTYGGAGSNTDTREFIGLSYLFNKYINCTLNFSLNQHMKSGAPLRNEGFINVSIANTIPLQNFSKERKETKEQRISKFLKEKIHKHKIIAILDTNENLVFDEGDQKLKDLKFKINNKDYLTNSKGEIIFKSKEDYVEALLDVSSAPSESILLKGSELETISMMEVETIYLFGKSANILTITGYADINKNNMLDIDSDRLLNKIIIDIYNPDGSEKITSIYVADGWGFAELPKEYTSVNLKVDQAYLPKRYTVKPDTFSVNIIPGEKTNVNVKAEIIYDVSGDVKVLKLSSSEINQVLENIEIKLDNRTARVNKDGSYKFNDVTPGKYTIRISNLPKALVSSASVISHKVVVGGNNNTVKVPKFELIGR